MDSGSSMPDAPKIQGQNAPINDFGLPDVGSIIRRLRKRRNISLRSLGELTDLSPSFLSAVERGESDISLHRLARIANAFDHDVGSLLGYSDRRHEPHFIRRDQHFSVDRGEDIVYEVARIPHLGLEVVMAQLPPDSRFREALRHEGVDLVVATEGELVLTYHGRDYVLVEGDCVVMSGAYSHSYKNTSPERASFLAIVTEEVF